MEASMARVLGIGGLFFKTDNPDALREWYSRVLGMEFFDWGGAWFPSEPFAAHAGSGTVLSPMKDTEYMAPSTREYMFNLVVDDIDGVLARCKQHGVEPIKTFPDDFNGRFAHIIDLEGRKIELWQPRPIDPK
jgi:predicted enzyme related to lactoylglutathione lyase